ncbi:MAG: hypothetical protein ABFS18_03465 [Thermodesulfobacteriota bacterium]
MKKATGTILAILLATLLCTACSKDEESITEKVPSKIDQINQRNADAIVKRIKTPLDKARLTQGLGDKRMEEMEEALQNQ